MVTPLRVEFVFTPAMLRAVDLAMIDSGIHDEMLRALQKQSHRRELLMAPVWFLAVIGLIAVFSQTFGTPGPQGFGFAFLMAGAIVAARLAARVKFDDYRNELRSQTKASRGRGLECTGPIVVTLSGEGLGYQDPSTRASFDWALASWVAAVGDFVVIQTMSRRMICIPIHELPTGVTADDVIGYVQQQHAAAGGAQEILTRYLQHAEHDCPGCGYTLLGVPEPRCPECGRLFGFEDL